MAEVEGLVEGLPEGRWPYRWLPRAGVAALLHLIAAACLVPGARVQAAGQHLLRGRDVVLDELRRLGIDTQVPSSWAILHQAGCAERLAQASCSMRSQSWVLPVPQSCPGNASPMASCLLCCNRSWPLSLLNGSFSPFV